MLKAFLAIAFAAIATVSCVPASAPGTSPASFVIPARSKHRPAPTPTPSLVPTASPSTTPTPSPTSTPTAAWKLGDPTLGKYYVVPAGQDGQCGTQSVSGTSVALQMSMNGTACYRDQIMPSPDGSSVQRLVDGQQYTWTFHYADSPTGMGYDQDARSLVWQVHEYGGSGNVCLALAFDNGGVIGGPQQWNIADDCNGGIDWRGPYTPGEQDDWKITALISQTNSGWVKVWRNGALVFSGNGPNYQNDLGVTGGPWWNFGPYKWRWELATGIGDLGNVTTMSTVGATFGDMTLTTP